MVGRRVVRVGLVAVVLVAVAAPVAAAKTTQRVFVGPVKGTRAFVALVADADTVAGYVSDGKDVSVWLDAVERDTPSTALVNRQGDTVGEVKFAGDNATGTVTLEGSTRRFRATKGKGVAGLYRGVAGTPGKVGGAEAGWVVLVDGRQRGTVRFIGPNDLHRVVAAPRLAVGVRSVQFQPPGITDPDTINLAVSPISDPDGI
jgi:hypothetical protein